MLVKGHPTATEVRWGMYRRAGMAKAEEGSALVDAAKAIGKAAGKIASIAGASAEPPAPKRRAKTGKLPKKNKSRLPRLEKKAQKKRLTA